MKVKLRLEKKRLLALIVITMILFLQPYISLGVDNTYIFEEDVNISTTLPDDEEKESEQVLMESQVNIGDYIEFGKYEGEPILWRIIHIDEEGSPILLSDKILTLKSFCTYEEPYDKFGNRPREGGEDSVWEKSPLRKWLNSSDEVVNYHGKAPIDPVVSTNSYGHEKGFLAEGNFTEEERGMLKPRTNKVLNNIIIHEDAADKVFLLSDDDIQEYILNNKEKLGQYNKAYPRIQTIYSTQSMPYEPGTIPPTRSLSPNKYYWYWKNNTEGNDDFTYSLDADGLGGVRPAIALRIVDIGTGNGTKEIPYRINIKDNRVKNLIVDPTSITMRIGEMIEINTYIEPFYATDQRVVWESSNNNIVEVDRNGNVIAQNSGRASLKVTTIDGNISKYISIVVTPESTENGIKIGDYIEFGKYYNKPILWRVININEDGSPMLIADKILTLKAFDAKGENTVGRDDLWNSRKQYGSNLWQTSTLRQWLNSADMKVDYKYNIPTKENVLYNAYDDEKGFLANGNFSEEERSLILNSKAKVLLPEVDAVEGVLEGGVENHKFSTLTPFMWDFHEFKEGYNTVGNYDNAYYTIVEDKVFLLSVKEVNDYIWRNMKLDYKYAKAGPTNEAVYNNEYGQLGLAPEYYWYSWLRTPITFDSYNIRTTDNYEEGLYQNIACDGRTGVRPAINLSSNSMIKSGKGTEKNPYTLNVQQETVNVINIELDRKEATLFVGNSMKLFARVIPDNASNKNIIWESENDSIATVNQEGIIFANSSGEVTVIATTEDGGYSDYIKIIVKETNNLKAKAYVNNDNKNIALEKIVSNGNSYVGIGSGEMLYSEDGKHWENIFLSNPERVGDIVWDGDKYVTLGEDFSIFTSLDGINWTKIHNISYLLDQGPGIYVIQYHLLYDKGIYVTIMNGIVFTSKDLINWESVYEAGWEIEYKGEVIRCSRSIENIFFDGETIFIIVGFSPIDDPRNRSITAIISSKDGSNWSTWLCDEEFKDLGSVEIQNITKDNEKFIAYGNMNKIYISYDGFTWEPKKLGFDSQDDRIFNPSENLIVSEILYNNNMYYGVMDGFLLFSDDGFHWKLDSKSLQAKDLYFGGVYPMADGRILLYSNYNLMGSFETNYLGNFYYKESENEDYIPIRRGKSQGENFIAYGNGIYLILNRFGDVFTSVDGLKWIQQPSIKGLSRYYLDELTFLDGKFMILESGSLRYRYSTDGITWNIAYLPEIKVDEKYKAYPIVNPSETPNGFILKENELIAYMSYYPYIWRTTDGINWTTELIRDEIAKEYSYIRYTDGLYLGQNHNDKIVISKDLKEWIGVSDFPIINSAYNIIGFVGGNNKYVSIFAESYQDRRFVGKYAISDNGIDWELKGLDLEELYGVYLSEEEFSVLKKTIMFEDIQWNGERFIGIVRYRVSPSSFSPWVRDIVTSTDGNLWESHYVDIRDNRTLNPPQVDDNPKSVLTDDKFIFVDNNNVIINIMFEEREFADINVSKVELETKSLTLKVGEKEALGFRIYPWNATNKNVIWKSSNENIALVDKEGIVTGVSAGESIITIITEDGNFSDSCIINILTDEQENSAREELINFINYMEYLRSENYTEESWTVLQEALIYAKSIIDNDKAMEIDIVEAFIKLIEAWEGLEIVENLPEIPNVDVEDWHIELFKKPFEEININFSHPVDLNLVNEYIFVSKFSDGREKLQGIYIEADQDSETIKVFPPNHGYDPGVYYLFINKDLSQANNPTKKLKKTIRMKFLIETTE
ncbi:Ig-like domain-containing protein [Tissierella pigra]|uniref:BIG2 domain-containing protein n=1 Tax=Tissierella pigra TaxID=2607614 RepID=A0A6N7XUP5_9FIRM|nr:Ig-like domain-containing protein [Tissierella pigra]MSU00254.1 hypothetical protein [Tissierella pigra]